MYRGNAPSAQNEGVEKVETINPKKPSQILTFLMAMVTVTCWATSYPTVRYLVPYYSPYSVAALRFFIATVILVAVAVVKKVRVPDKRDYPMFILSGFVGIFLFTVLLNIGVTYVVSGVGSFIINSAPIFTLIMSRLFLKEIVKPACWIGVMLGFFGLATVMLSQIVGFALSIGVFLLLFASVATSAYNVVQRGLLRKYTFLEAVLFSIIPADVFFLVCIPNIVRDFSNSPPLFANLIILFIGVFPGATAYFTWGYALSRAEKTTHVTVFLYLTPFLAALFGFLWLGETMTILAFLGGILIIAGMFITNTLGKSR